MKGYAACWLMSVFVTLIAFTPYQALASSPSLPLDVRIDDSLSTFPFQTIPIRQVGTADGLASVAGTQPGGGSWSELGPKPITNPANTGTYGVPPFSGRVTALAVNSSNTSNIYLGAAQGGVWKSLDGGATWTALTDTQSSLAVGVITISPDGKAIFVGTGEPNHSGDSYFGNGVLKSTDSGRTWILIGSAVFSNSAISGIILVGGSQNKLLVSTTKAACCGGAYAVQNQAGVGVFLSTDGGQSWTRTLVSTDYVGISQILADPGNSNKIYAADFAGQVWDSTDGGSTWSGLRGYSQASQQGRVIMAASPASPNNLLMAFANSTDDLIGIFRLNLLSNTLTTLGIPPTPSHTSGPCNGQCNYDFVLAQDQSNANSLFLGTVDLFKSTDGGLTWNDLGGYNGGNLHVDQHAIAFSPSTSATVYVGNDGGVWKSTDGGATWANLNNGLGITQFYSLAGSPSTVLIGGTQDNGCDQYKGTSSWSLIQSGDGGWTGVESTNTNILYCNYVYLNFQKSTDGGKTWNNAVTGINQNDKSLFFAPTVQDPNNPGTVYICSVRVYKSTNFAQSWTDVSGVLGTYPISAMALAPSNSNILYIGDTHGVVRESSNGGVTWQVVTSKSYYVTSIAVDPSDSNTAYIAFAGLGLFKFTLSGGTWQSVALSPPQAGGVDVIRLNPNSKAIYIGTDLGVYYSADGGATWATVGSGLPNAAVFDLDYVASTNQLVAATHGRGVWAISLAQPVQLTTSYSAQGGGSGYSAPTLSYVYNGLAQSAILTTTPTGYTVDSGTSWSVTGTLPGSSGSERWQANQGLSGTVTSSEMITVVYYHQFNIAFNYAVSDQGSGYSPPTFSYVQFGSSKSATSGSTSWADANSLFSYQGQLGGSSQVERWLTSAPSGTVSSSSAVTVSYYHQYLLAVNRSIFGGGTPGAPTFTSTSLGSSSNTVLSGTPIALWLDSGAAYTVTNPLPTSTSTERWLANTASGTVRGSVAVAFVFHHQYYLNVVGGNVQSSWYESGTTASVTTPTSYGRVSGVGSRINSYAVDSGPRIAVGLSSNAQVSVPMSATHTLTFGTIVQYQVVLDAGATAALSSITPPTFPGDNYWYDNGTSVSLLLNGVYGRASGTGTRLINYEMNGGSVIPVSSAGVVKVLDGTPMTSPRSVATSIVAQYRLTLSGVANGALYSVSAPAITSDNNWYDSGASVQAVFNYIWNATTGQSRSNAVSYALDGIVPNTLKRAGSGTFTVAFTMDKTRALGIIAVTQYRLSVAGPQAFRVTPSSPTQDDFFDSGSSASVTAPSVWNQTAESRLNLVSYSVDGNVVNVTRGTGDFMTPLFTFDQPRSVAFTPVKQNLVSFTFTDAAGTGQIIPSNLQIEVGGSILDVPNLRIFLDEGTSFRLTTVSWEGENIALTSANTYTARVPQNVTVKDRVYDVNVKVADLFGLPVSGAHVQVLLANGTVVSGTTSGDGTYTIRMVPLGTFAASISNLGSIAQVNGDASTQTEVVAMSSLSFPVVGVLVAGVVFVVTVAFLVLRRRS